MRAWMNVATLVRTKTQQGGLVAQSAPGLPFLLHAGMEVAFVPPQHDALRHTYVQSVEEKSNGTFLVYFDGIESIEQARLLVDCDILIRRVDVPAHTLVWGAQGLTGFEVHDERRGFIGIVDDMLDYPGQMLLSVVRTDEDGANIPIKDDAQTVLIPLVDAIVHSIDEDERRIAVELPNGLLDL